MILKTSGTIKERHLTATIIPFGGLTQLNIPTDEVLESVKGRCSDGVVVIGYDDNGELYFASSMADGGEVLWLLEMAKKALLDIEL